MAARRTTTGLACAARADMELHERNYSVRVTLAHTTSDSEASAIERLLGEAGIDYDMRLEPKLDAGGPCLLARSKPT